MEKCGGTGFWYEARRERVVDKHHVGVVLVAAICQNVGSVDRKGGKRSPTHHFGKMSLKMERTTSRSLGCPSGSDLTSMSSMSLYCVLGRLAPTLIWNGRWLDFYLARLGYIWWSNWILLRKLKCSICFFTIWGGLSVMRFWRWGFREFPWLTLGSR